jgi:predicted aconitase
VPEADALMALDEAVIGMRIAIRDGDLRRAREMRHQAWGYVELLPLGATWRQRRTLGRLKELLRAAERRR